MNIGPIKNPTISFKPSQDIVKYIKKLDVKGEVPHGIQSLLTGKAVMKERKPFEHRYFTCEKDREFIQSLELNSESKVNTEMGDEKQMPADDILLNLEDLYWLHDYISKENENSSTKVYFHEIFKGTEVILPKNIEIPRNEELEKRCQRLKAEQQNRDYNKMTKNIDNIRKKLPEDTIAYQLKQMNRHLIAVFQFILSVVAGFAFGFIGVELIIGNLDFGFRLLLGIICSLTIALAELYFLAKKLNEDLNFEFNAEKNMKKKVN